MGILAWIVLGLIAGLIASWLTGDRAGWLMTIVIGIVGSLLGSFIFSLLGYGAWLTFSLEGLVVATIGAVILILIAREVRKRR
jgi:uncharacterized membrane protein YeaQ/YmgE (transglycosylase-associated protein family)